MNAPKAHRCPFKKGCPFRDTCKGEARFCVWLIWFGMASVIVLVSLLFWLG